MPIYEYRCGKCGKMNEFLESSSRRRARSCAYCGSKSLQKQFSAFAPRIKGGASKRCHGCSDSTCPHAGY
ncbi:MAG: FmdB family zinc ribbon protein [Planctomycetota bacterium]